MVTTNDEALARRIERLRNHGKNPDLKNRISEFGYNYRISEITALLGVQQMTRASAIIADRRRAAAFYDKHLQGVPGLRVLKLPAGAYSTYYKYIAMLADDVDRTQVKTTLREKYDVSLTGEVYSELCHTEPLWERFTYCGRQRSEGQVACSRWPSCGCSQKQDGFPGADYISQHHVCLPVYPRLSEAELEHVVTSLLKVLSQTKES